MEHEKPAKKPVDYDELFPGRFLKAGLLKGRVVTVTISAVDQEELPQDNGKYRIRGIISFGESKMQMVLNSTNGQCLREMFGKRVQEWVGKRVMLCPEQDRFGGKLVDAIRIYGSPDLTDDVTVEINLPRRRSKPRVLRCSPPGKQAAREPGEDDK